MRLFRPWQQISPSIRHNGETCEQDVITSGVAVVRLVDGKTASFFVDPAEGMRPQPLTDRLLVALAPRLVGAGFLHTLGAADRQRFGNLLDLTRHVPDSK